MGKKRRANGAAPAVSHTALTVVERIEAAPITATSDDNGYGTSENMRHGEKERKSAWFVTKPTDIQFRLAAEN